LLLLRDRREHPEQPLRFMNVTTHPDNAREPLAITQPRLDAHEAPLGKSKKDCPLRDEPLAFAILEQHLKQPIAALDPRPGIRREIVPGKSAVIAVRRIRQHDIDRWQLE